MRILENDQKPMPTRCRCQRSIHLLELALGRLEVDRAQGSGPVNRSSVTAMPAGMAPSAMAAGMAPAAVAARMASSTMSDRMAPVVASTHVTPGEASGM